MLPLVCDCDVSGERPKRYSRQHNNYHGICLYLDMANMNIGWTTQGVGAVSCGGSEATWSGTVVVEAGGRDVEAFFLEVEM